MKKTTEDYLKAIYIIKKTHGSVRGVNIAEYFNVSRPTVSAILKRLLNEKLIYINASHEILLNPEGEKIAVNTLEKHKTLSTLLENLGVSEQVAIKDACEMEHTVSNESFEALKKLADNKFTPAVDKTL